MKILKRINKKGVTLVELICVLAVFGVLMALVLPVLGSYFKTQSLQLRENAQRIDVQLIKTYMGEDIHFCKRMSLEDSSTLKITSNTGVVVRYTLQKANGKISLVRKSETGHVKVFGEVKDVTFRIPTSRLVKTELSVDSGALSVYNFDTARWSYRKSLLEFLELEGVFMYSDALSYNGEEINASSQSLYINGDFDTSRSDLNGGAFGNVQNIYVNGNFTVTYGITVGNADIESRIFVNGDLILSGGATINNTVFVSGNFIQSGGGNITGNVYVGGDVTLSGGPNIPGNIYYGGTLNKPTWMSKPTVICDPYVLIPSFPTYDMLQLKPREWFENNGYTILESNEYHIVQTGDRLYIDGTANLHIDNTHQWGPLWPNDVIIACSGDVTIDGHGNCNLTGLVFAPSGSVYFNNFNIFEGIILSDDNIKWPRGGSYIYGKTLKEIISNPELYPFEEE